MDKLTIIDGDQAQSVYDRRKALVAEEWAEYQETKNPMHLAVICRELPFFDHPEVGEEIAHLLTADYFQELDQFSDPCP